LQTISILLQLQEVYFSALPASATSEITQTFIRIPSTSQLLAETLSLSWRLVTILLGYTVVLFASHLFGIASLSAPKSTEVQYFSQNSAEKSTS
jgi:hypothetical protein